jgi:hypothetical protein
MDENNKRKKNGRIGDFTKSGHRMKKSMGNVRDGNLRTPVALILMRK